MLADKPIYKVAGKFGVKISNIVRQDTATLTYVYVINNLFILRGHPREEFSQSRFLHQVDLIQNIRNLFTFEFPTFQKSETGEYWVIQDDIVWTSYQCIKGSVVCTWFSLEQAAASLDKSVVRLLYSLHQKTRNLFKRENEYFFLPDVAKCVEKLKGIITMRERVCFGYAYEKVSKVFSKSETVFVHGDFHHGNILLGKNGKPTGLIDFDWCRVGHPFEDVSFLFMMMLRRYTEQVFRFNEQRFTQLLEWYGIRAEDVPLLRAWILLYAFFDLNVFSSSKMPKARFYFEYQHSLVTDLCARWDFRH